jgi:hypothetical protein
VDVPKTGIRFPAPPFKPQVRLGFFILDRGQIDRARIPTLHRESGSNPSRALKDPGIFSLAPWDPRDRTPSRSAALKRCAGSLERLALGIGWERVSPSSDRVFVMG